VDGLACLATLRREYPRLPVVMLSAFDRPQLVRRSAEEGARAYLVKTVPPEVLLEVVEQVAFSEPGEFVARGVGDVPTGDAAARLTERELVVLTAVGRGLSNKEIARELWITEQTVKFHLRNVYAKLGLAGRDQAAAYAYREGLVSEEQRT
jgi:NarL family two-component system response regulator LiaR